MANQAEIVDRVVALIHTCVPAEDLSRATVPALACLVGGAVLVLWGARAIRSLIVLACVAGGAYGGWFVAQNFAKPPIVGLVAGAVVVGMIGLLAARLWIAGLSGALAALVALSVYGYQQSLLERFSEFARTYQQPQPTVQNEFPLAEPGAASAKDVQRPIEVAIQFVERLHRQGDPLLRNTILCVGGAGLVGLIIGLVAYRWAMIFWTSLAGMVLIVAGSVILLTNLWQGWHDVAVRNASTVGVVLLVVWLIGMFVQWRGTRRVVAAVGKPAEAMSVLPKAT
jgi:hypothetical protein